MQSLRRNILELCTVFARPDVKAAWDLHIHDILVAAEEEGVADSVQIRALFNTKPNAKAPPRTNISYIIMPSMSLLNRVDSDQKMTVAECLEAIHADVARFDAMLSNPAMFNANSPDMDAEEFITLTDGRKMGQVGKLEVHVRGLLQQRSLRTQHADGTSV